MYILTVLDLCFDFLNLKFDLLDQNWVCFDFVFDLKLLLCRGIAGAKLLLLDFQSQNIIRAPQFEYYKNF